MLMCPFYFWGKIEKTRDFLFSRVIEREYWHEIDLSSENSKLLFNNNYHRENLQKNHLMALPASNYKFKVNRYRRKRYEICSKLTIKTPERRQWRRSGVFANFEHVIDGWERCLRHSHLE